MPHITFLRFISPSLLAMILFIALPIVSVLMQSMYVQHEQVMVVTENCGPFGCTKATTVDAAATELLRKSEPLGRFAGFTTYADFNHLAIDEIQKLWAGADGFSDFFFKLYNLPFYKALFFTLFYTLVTPPLVILFGLILAFMVNTLPNMTKGPIIFTLLMPMIITPLVGALVLYWMVDARGILGSALQVLFDDPDLSLKASTPLNWVMLIVYGAWSSIPFAFIVFYAGLQTVSKDSIEAAIVDGANRWQTTWWVSIPHLMPLVVFVALMQIMDGVRIFEPIVSFSAETHATSLSYIIFSDLNGDKQLFGSAATTSMITVVLVCILLIPVLIRTWRDFNKKDV